MNNEKTRTGLIGFFDILGYQNLLERNEPETVAKDVLPILTSIGEKVAKVLKEMPNVATAPTPAAIKKHEELIRTMSWLVFSDTVLLTLPIDEVDPVAVRHSWMTFLVAVVVLQGELFGAGLPTRGAIEYGKFFVKDTCFAGRTIVTAYQLCHQIQIAACVFSEGAANEFRRMEENAKDTSLYGTFVIEYLVPTKNGEKRLLAVMAYTDNFNLPDIHHAVMHAFWGNKKDISLSARQKAENTEQRLEFIHHQSKKIESIKPI